MKLVPNKYFTSFILGKSLLCAGKIPILPTFTALRWNNPLFLFGKYLFSTRLSPVASTVLYYIVNQLFFICNTSLALDSCLKRHSKQNDIVIMPESLPMHSALFHKKAIGIWRHSQTDEKFEVNLSVPTI